MVNNYKRKSNQNSWDEASMKNAIEKVAAGEMDLNKAPIQFLLPKTTLKRKFEKYKSTQNIDTATCKKLGRFEQVFTHVQETELATYVKHIENRLFGLTTKNLQKLAYDLAEKNNKNHSFDTSKKWQKTNKNDSSSDDDDTECLYCSHLYAESSGGWVQCPKCRLWAHCACAGVEHEDDEIVFLCEKCAD